ncbi:MAG TPA: response regulator transcription factor [Kofleriaceae bacterium]|jgi:DNA-binding response OmpR family regulator
MLPIRAVLVDDEPEHEAIIVAALELASIVTHVVRTANDALAEVPRVEPEIILLGNLTNIAPVLMLRALRERTTLPVIALLVDARSVDRIAILDAGADDALARTSNPAEIAARVRSTVRRARGLTQGERLVLAIGSVTIDVETRSVHLGDIEMSLTTSEFLALRALAHSHGRPLSRDQLLHALHGAADDAFDRSIDVVISRLRAKLGPEAARLKTIRGVGYMLGV